MVGKRAHAVTTTNKKTNKWTIKEKGFRQFDIVSPEVKKINGRTGQQVLCTAYGEGAALKILLALESIDELVATKKALKIAKDALELVAQGICDLRYIGTGEYVCDGACEKFANKTLSEMEHLDE